MSVFGSIVNRYSCLNMCLFGSFEQSYMGYQGPQTGFLKIAGKVLAEMNFLDLEMLLLLVSYE